MKILLLTISMVLFSSSLAFAGETECEDMLEALRMASHKNQANQKKMMDWTNYQPAQVLQEKKHWETIIKVLSQTMTAKCFPVTDQLLYQMGKNVGLHHNFKSSHPKAEGPTISVMDYEISKEVFEQAPHE